MRRRNFLALLAAPLIVRPTLEEIDRLTWRRRFFPGWSPTPGLIEWPYPGWKDQHPWRFGAFFPKIGDTVWIRRPERFVK